MSGYRLYCLDGDGSFTTVHEIDAASDAEAIAKARQKQIPVRCELWEGARMVAVIDAHRA